MSRTVRVVTAVFVVCLPQFGCGSPHRVYQVVRSDDEKCACEITEYREPAEAHTLLDLRIVLGSQEVLARSYFGRKRSDGKKDQFAVSRAGRFYYLSVVGHPEYALAAIDTERRGRLVSIDQRDEQAHQGRF
jgi:hypothetical protein